MNRTKFRGIEIGTNKMVYGNLIQNNDATFIVEKEEFSYIGYCNDCDRPYINQYKVQPETIGQYSGINDIQGNELYKGDIVEREFMEFGKDNFIGVVNFVDGAFIIENEELEESHFLFSETDVNKKIGSIHENKTIDIISTKKKAFELWSDEKKEICDKLNITITERNSFEFDFDKCFDRFKDLKQVEHVKILSFVKERNELHIFTDEIDCIKSLYKEFNKNKSSQLSELNIKAAIYAAYIEVREML